MSFRDKLAKDARTHRGLGNPFLLAGAPVNGAAGSYVKDALVGSLLIDTSAGRLFIATVATGATVTWTLVGSQV